MLISVNITKFMGPANRRREIAAYAYAVDAALTAGTFSGPLHTRCPECSADFADLDEAYEDTEHVIIATTSDTTAVIVGCEGYWVVDPNLVGFDRPNWSDMN